MKTVIKDRTVSYLRDIMDELIDQSPNQNMYNRTCYIRDVVEYALADNTDTLYTILNSLRFSKNK